MTACSSQSVAMRARSPAHSTREDCCTPSGGFWRPADLLLHWWWHNRGVEVQHDVQGNSRYVGNRSDRSVV